MTVIAAITDGEVAWVGADSQTQDGNGFIYWSNDKIQRRTLEGGHIALLAFSGSSRLRHLTAHASVPFPVPPPNRDHLDGWAHEVAAWISGLALDARPPVANDNGSVDGAAVLAFRGRVWHLWSDSADELQSTFGMGSGGDLACGALDALVSSGMDHAERVMTALEVACGRQADCGGDLHVWSTDGRVYGSP